MKHLRSSISELRSGDRCSGFSRARQDLLPALQEYQEIAADLIEELMRQRRIGSEARARRIAKRLQKGRNFRGRR